MDLAFPFFLFVWLFSGKSKADLTRRAPPASSPGAAPRPAPAPRPAVSPPPAVRPTVTTATAPVLARTAPAPWPQVVPAGLPAFPGPGWVPDEPPGPGVAARAAQLLSTLWAHGEGTRKTEQTGGRWITYRATQMGTKRGVVAYRLAAPVAPPAASPAPPPITMAMPASSSSPAPRTALPTLRRGSSGPDVVMLQQRLGIPADGKFGPQTEASVRTFQRSRGLTADGIVGPQTWAALYGAA